MRITIIGCGRWGSLIGWYLDTLGHEVTLYGRAESRHMQRFLAERRNDLLQLGERIHLTTEMGPALDADILVLAVGAQSLREVCRTMCAYGLRNRRIVLCMKGLEKETGKRLTEIVADELDPSNRVAVWLGPGHVQDFYAGIPSCMVIDSADNRLKQELIEAFSGPLIRFYFGQDLIGNEIGAAAKNVIGIGAGMLDGSGMSTLKGPLMSRGTREIARLIKAAGGSELSAYGLCHLGDYQATLFSPYSHNRRFGEAFVKNEPYSELAEGYDTVQALMVLAGKYGVELPICGAVYEVLFGGKRFPDILEQLFARSLKHEFR
ncbi:MAG: glycerol-3-phosphate dehydrogenase [Clostridia bacterium]|nr:glycerol-3-phosphate dehydrogenase [Clostridia bacterium]